MQDFQVKEEKKITMLDTTEKVNNFYSFLRWFFPPREITLSVLVTALL